MAAEDGFAGHADPLVAAMTPRTRAVIVNSPCNPTGGMMRAHQIQPLVEAGADRAVHGAPLVAAMPPRTRAGIVNSPCNPTGGMMSAHELERLVEAAAERGVLVIA